MFFLSLLLDHINQVSQGSPTLFVSFKRANFWKIGMSQSSGSWPWAAWDHQQWYQPSASSSDPGHTGQRWHPNPSNLAEVKLRRSEKKKVMGKGSMILGLLVTILLLRRTRRKGRVILWLLVMILLPRRTRRRRKLFSSRNPNRCLGTKRQRCHNWQSQRPKRCQWSAMCSQRLSKLNHRRQDRKTIRAVKGNLLLMIYGKKVRNGLKRKPKKCNRLKMKNSRECSRLRNGRRGNSQMAR